MEKALTVLLITIITGTIHAQNHNTKFDSLIKQCASINSGNYRCNAYLELANYLQTLETEKAIEIMKDYANTYQFEDQIIILTRMLFVSKNNSVLRRPYLGAAFFFCGTDYDDWITEPIEIIKGIPFLIIGGYSLGGLPESSIKYLEYCIENGKWTENIYSTKSETELKEALDIFLNDNRWNNKLTEANRTFFEKQIKE
ncbi:MAG TPA: hypothetical protein PLL66_00755 [Bacteroidales bacterium]|nr:hypothetical protein [Bacteroidales bacterium]